MTNNELGIDNALPVATLIGEIGTALATLDSDGDGQIEALEIANKVQFLATKAFFELGFQKIKDSIKEFLDASYVERKQLIRNVADANNWANDERESVVEDWIEYINELSLLITRTRTAFAK